MSDSPQNTGGMEGARPSPATRLIHPVDTVLAAIIIALMGWLWYLTTQFQEVSFLLADNLPPAVFPRILLATIVIFAVLMPFEHILLKRAGKDIDKDRSEPIKRITWSTMAVLLGVMALSPLLGTFLTMLSVCILVPLLWGERRLKIVIPFGILFPLLVTLVFNIFLGVYFEPGVLGISFQ